MLTKIINYLRLPIVFVPFTVIVLGIFIFFGFFYEKEVLFNDTQEIKVSSSPETAVLVNKVSKLIFLPEDEIPTIATVSRPELLQEQEFFKKAKAGDKVLVYEKAKQAILYDPKADKIITIAPIVIDVDKSQKSESSNFDTEQIQF